MRKLEGKTIIVTGGGKGLGAAYAVAVAALGAKVSVADIEPTDETVSRIQGLGGDAMGASVDVSNRAAVEAFVAKTEETFGDIHGLVNNAALFAALPIGKLEDITSELFDQVLSVNVRGSFECLRAVLPSMRRRKYGKIVNISSGTVFRGTPEMLAYVSSKGAIVAMTRSAARELGADGIRVNALAPGLTQSDGTLEHPWQLDSKDLAIQSQCLKRLEMPDDLTGTVTFLLSPESDFMTGQVLVVDGGGIMP